MTVAQNTDVTDSLRYPKLSFPSGLFGRAVELSFLTEAARRPQACAAVILQGPPGIGKSALLYELRKHVNSSGGWCAIGAFVDRTLLTPFGGLSLALADLARQILAEPPPRLRRIQQDLRSRVGSDGALLTELAPEFELILGKQPALPADTVNQRYRIISILRLVFDTLTQGHFPLVLCIDDLQWADINSLDILRRLLLESARPDMLIVLAVRTSTPTNLAVDVTLKELLRQRQDIAVLALSLLGQPTIAQILAAAVASNDAVNLEQSAATLLAVTHGNPLLLRQTMFASEPADQWLWHEQSREWVWNPAAALYLPASAQLQSMIAMRLNQMDSVALECLAVAACVGYDIDPKFLAGLLNVDAVQVAGAVQQGIDAGLVIAPGEHGTQSHLYRFAHGEVQRAMHDQLDPVRCRAVQRQIGDYLLRITPPDVRRTVIFTIVSHLTAALDPLEDEQRAHEMAALLIEAAQMALRISAIPTAAKYANQAATWAEVAPEGWHDAYDLLLESHELVVRTALYTGDYDTMTHHCQIVLRHAQSGNDKVGVYQSSITAATLQGNYTHAIELLREGLADLGVQIPHSLGIPQLFVAYVQMRLALGRRTDYELRTIPTTTDRTWWKIGELVTSAYMALQWSEQALLLAYLTLHGVRWTVKHGSTPFSVLAYSLYAILLENRLRDPTGSYRFARLAVESSMRPENDHQRAGVLLTLNALVLHHTQPIATTIEALRQARRLALEDGDVRLATDCTLTYLDHAYLAGAPLPSLVEEGSKMIAELEPYGETVTLLLCRILHQYLLNLTVATEPPYTLGAVNLSETEALARLEASDNRFGLFAFYSLKAQLALLFDDPQAAVQAADQALTYSDAVGIGLFTEDVHCAVDTLARLVWLNHAPAAEHRRQHSLIRKNLRQLQRLAAKSPANHLHRLRLVEAELASLRGNTRAAEDAYTAAWSAAAEGGFLNDEAFIAEMAEHYFLRCAHFGNAAEWHRRAREAYQRWGSSAKVRYMNRNVLLFATGDVAPFADSMRAAPPEAFGAVRHDELTNDLQALNAFDDPQQIVQLFLSQVMARMQASRILFLLVREDQMTLYAEQHADSATPSYPRFVLDNATHGATAPLTLVRLAMQQRKTVSARPAEVDGFAARDPYLSGKLSTAALCMPLRARGHIPALLVVERAVGSTLSQDAEFAVADVVYTEVLGAHAALLIENSILHQRLVGATTPVAGAEPGAELSVWLMGTMRIVHRTRELVPELHGYLRDFVAMLLLYTPGMPITRSEIASKLWPDTPDNNALNNLRNLLHRLRTTWPEVNDLLEITRYQLQWKAHASIWVDVRAFEQGVAEAAHLNGMAAINLLRQSVAFYAGELLPGMHAEWLSPIRERALANYLAAVSRLVELLVEQHDLSTALHYAQLLVSAAPLHEEPYRHLIRVHGLLGDAAAARHAYEACAAMLADEFAVGPSPATEAIYHRFVIPTQ